MELNFRTLKADEIDVRVGNVTYNDKTKGVSLLLYKDARVDMALLDEVCKPFGWSREHKEIKGVCYCGIGIKDPKTGEWVYKWDAGKESNTEKEKGEASDSFKRAGVNWGIGRELYTAPFIFVKLTENDFYASNGKWYLQNNIKFSVKEIDYDENRQISKLIIVDNRGATIFSKPQMAYLEKAKVESKPIIKPQLAKPVEVPKPEQPEVDIQYTAEEVEEYLEICSDLDNAQNFAQVEYQVNKANGKRYEQHVRDKANDICKQKGYKKEQ